MSYILFLRGIHKVTTTATINLTTSLFSQRCIHAVIAPCSYLHLKIPSLTSRRSFWETFPSIKPFLHDKDGLSKENYELIYRTKYFNYIFYGQLICLLGFAGQIFFSCGYTYEALTTGKVSAPTEVLGLTVTYDLISLGVLGMMSFQNYLIFKAAQSAILRVYYNDIEDEYVFISLGLNPFKSRLRFCKPGCMKEDSLPHALIIFGSHKLHDKRIFLRYDAFKTMWHYNRLLEDYEL